MKVNEGYIFCFENCIRGALTISTPGVKVRLECPRQAYIEIENFAVNIKTKEYNILLIDITWHFVSYITITYQYWQTIIHTTHKLPPQTKHHRHWQLSLHTTNAERAWATRKANTY